MRLAALAAWMAMSLPAQTPTATLVGRIDDASGATIPGAKIVMRNLATGEERQAQTEEDGGFAVASLAPGAYEFTAEKAGFKRLHEPRLTLEVDQTLRLELQMQVGAVTESVEVTTEAPLLNTENASRGQVIATEEIQELPLEGRDFNDLSFLVPGVARSAQGGSGSSLNINGARSDNTNFIVDGFTNQSPRGGSAVTRPPVDAIQEFKLQTSGYSAEHGRLAGGLMNMALKSGGNRFHGGAFYYARNAVFDARNFFDQTKSDLKRDQFGATLHGPVVVPKLYNGRNRLFFLFSWESYRQTQGINRLGRVPSELERAGDFSQTLDPATGKTVLLRDPLATGACSATQSGGCFPGNRIPVSRIHPVAANIAPFYPAVNRPGQLNNFQANQLDQDQWDTFLGKGDFRVSEKDTVSVRYMRRYNNTSNPFSGSDTGSFGFHSTEPPSLGGVTWTRLVAPELVQEVRLGFSRQDTRQTPVQGGENWNAKLGLPDPLDPRAYAFPRVTVRDVVDIGNAASMPLHFATTNVEGGLTLSWVRSRHMWRFGGSLLRMGYAQPGLNNQRGTYNFLGRWTNAPYGDFLLGLLNNSSRRLNSADPNMRSWASGLFFQDDWRVTRSLTVNLGVRYELNTPMREQHNRMSNFVPELGKIVIAGRDSVPGLDALLEQNGLTGMVAFAPDLDIPESLVFPSRNLIAPRVGLAWRPFGGTSTVIRSGYGIFYGSSGQQPVRGDLAETFPFMVARSYTRNTANPLQLTFSDPFPSGRGTVDGVSTSAGTELHPNAPGVQSWNFTLEHDLGRENAIEVAYVGSKGTHLPRKYNINQPFRDPALRPSGTGAFPRPYAGIGDVDYYRYGCNSSYNAGIVSWRRRFTGGFFVRANYIYAKSIDEASQAADSSDGGIGAPQDSRNLWMERGRSDWDTGHSFTVSYAWQVPLGQNMFLRNWQLAGSGRMFTGQPFTPKTTNVQLDQGEASRPDRLGKGTAQAPTVDRWFDVGAFAVVPLGAYRMGNSGRNILDGPGQSLINMGLTRRFRTGEGGSLQFRWEVFNVVNHPNFNLPNNAVNAVNAATIVTAGSPRSMQWALHYTF